MTGLKTRSADYQPVHGPITTNMAELEKNGELPQEGFAKLYESPTLTLSGLIVNGFVNVVISTIERRFEISSTDTGLMVSGFSTFAPKFIEYQFGLSSGVAAMYVGLAAIPAGGGATFVGGFIVKRFNLTVRGILKFCIGVTVVACFLALTFLIHCPYVPFVSYT
nr:hypothetical protein BaRGS_027067 [Batillaria attramentaria]